MSRNSDDAVQVAERAAAEKNTTPADRIAAAQVKATAALVDAVEALTKMVEKQGDSVGSHIQHAAHGLKH
jgi:hypothetical protein